MMKRAYLEATELLNKHKQLQALQEGQQEEVAKVQGARRSRIDGSPFVPKTTCPSHHHLLASRRTTFEDLNGSQIMQASSSGRGVRLFTPAPHLLQPSCEASS
jgi:hypothetical protein